ncbi:MAG: hypothetical protein E7028_10580 [Planctomycetaceae bacterium]|nr:hypothetical protein [Planctomycetaceae bacterium]MBQ2822764.1 hypothetical protein [Thermoguttaceae bacterium]
MKHFPTLALFIILLFLSGIPTLAREIDTAIAAYSYRQFSFFETIDKVAELGVRNLYGFNFQTVGGGIEGKLDPAALSDAELEKIRLKLTEKKISLIALYYGSFPEDEAACRKIFERSKSLGIQTFVSEPDPKLLPMLDRIAGEFGMKIGLHGHDRQSSPNTWHPLLVADKCRNLKNIAAFNDTGHWIRSGLDPTDGIEILGKFTIGFDLHDLNAEGKDVPLGTGVGNIGRMLRALKRIPGPPVLIGIEYNSNPQDPTADIKQCLEFLKDPKPNTSLNKFSDGFYAGAVSVDILPPKPVHLSGQFSLRVSQGAKTSISANILALTSVKNGQTVPVILISMDTVVIREQFNIPFRQALKEKIPEIPTENVIICATHTHSAPHLGQDRPDLPKDGSVMTSKEYIKFAIDRIVPGIRQAMEKQVPAKFGFGLGFVNIAYNRRAVYADGSAVMYGKTDRPDFRSLEGMTDNDLDMFCVWNQKDELIAMLLTIACPSQENENSLTLDGDFWARTRESLTKKYGKDTVILGMCGAAGDQSPHIRYRAAAEQRMTALRNLSRADELARRITCAVDDIYDVVASEKSDNPLMKYEYLEVDLPQRIPTKAEYDDAIANAERLQSNYEKTGNTASLGMLGWHKRIITRYENLKLNPKPTYPTSISVLRIGDIALCTNQFELYSDYGVQMKARSKAAQTFVIQLASGAPDSGTYLPTAHAVKGGGYGAVIQSNSVGPEGGLILTEETVKAIERLFSEK